MRTKPPQGVGVMIRDVLREYQPLSITEVRREVNVRRNEKGLRPIALPTMRRYILKTVQIGMVRLDGTEPRQERLYAHQLENAPERNLYRIVRGNTMDRRWGYLPQIVAGKRT